MNSQYYTLPNFPMHASYLQGVHKQGFTSFSTPQPVNGREILIGFCMERDDLGYPHGRDLIWLA